MKRRGHRNNVLLGPPESPTITAADVIRARAAWRRHAPRRYWGLVDARAVPVLPKQTEIRSTQVRG